MSEKEIILDKLQNNPQMTLADIARSFNWSLRTFMRRLEEYSIEHGRKRGMKVGHRKPLKIS